MKAFSGYRRFWRYRALRAVFLMLALAAFSCGGSKFRFPVMYDPPLPAADFRLQDGDGKEVRLSHVQAEPGNRLVLVIFGYGKCADICPQVLSRVARSLKRLDEAALARIRVFFISVDPAGDKPKDIQRYAASFHPKIIGLWGEKRALEEIRKKYLLFVRKRLNPDGSHVWEHTTSVFWIEPGARITKRISHNFLPGDLVHDIKLFVDR